MNWKALSGALVSVAAMSYQAAANDKPDILGLSPNMTQAEARQVATKHGWKCKTQTYELAIIDDCESDQLSNRDIEIHYAAKLPNHPVFKILVTGTSSIKDVADRFGKRLDFYSGDPSWWQLSDNLLLKYIGGRELNSLALVQLDITPKHVAQRGDILGFLANMAQAEAQKVIKDRGWKCKTTTYDLAIVQECETGDKNGVLEVELDYATTIPDFPIFSIRAVSKSEFKDVSEQFGKKPDHQEKNELVNPPQLTSYWKLGADLEIRHFVAPDELSSLSLLQPDIAPDQIRENWQTSRSQNGAAKTPGP